MTKKIFILFFLVFSIAPQAHARIDMVPHIVVMEPRERASEITILNLSNETRDFKLSVINNRQTPPKGTYEKISEPLDPNFDPDKNVRFSPRSFTLGPNGKQKVRLSLRKPADLPDGEYRFHLLAISYATEEERAPSSENVKIVLSANVGISIPVVIRHGNVSATSRLSNFELKGPQAGDNVKKPALHFTASREGNGSVLGRVDVEWAENGTDFKEIGFIRGFKIFTELDSRQGRVPLNALPTSGTLKVTYKDEENNKIYDQIIFDL